MILLDMPMQTRLGVMDEVARLIEPVEIDVAKAAPSFLPLLGQAWGLHRRSPEGHRTALRFTSHIALFFVFHEFSEKGDSDPVMSVRVYEFPTASAAFDGALDVVDGTRESYEAKCKLWSSTEV